MTCVAVAVICADKVAGQYDPPPTYYSTAIGTGAALKAQLNEIIDQHTAVSYSNREAPLENLDKDPNNASNVILVYSGYSVSNTTFPISGQADTEHLWPNSYGIDDTNPAYGDLFNLRPCDSTVNGFRANKYYDNGGTLPAHAEAPLCRGDSDSWEVRDIEKGDIARAMFYMDTRYEDDANDGFARDLTLTDDTASISSTAANFGRLSTLLDWHFRDPVSVEEKARNHLVYTTYQHNRNPYVDRPEFVWAVFGLGANNSRLYVGGVSPPDGASAASVVFRVIRNAAAPSQSVTLNKIGTHPTTYNVTAGGSAVSSAAASGQMFVGGTGSRLVPVELASTATSGGKTGTIVIDNTDLTTAGAGFGSADGNDAINMAASVLERSNASFASPADQNTLTIDFGTVYRDSGPHTLPFSLHNLEVLAGYTAGLDLNTVTPAGHTAFLSTDLAPFSNLAAGQARTFTAALNPTAAGTWQVDIALTVSDENVPGAAAGPGLTLVLKGAVIPVVPADFDADVDVDSADLDIFLACTAGPGVPVGPECAGPDLDGDGDVDQEDFGVFQRCISGPQAQPDPVCINGN